MPSWLAVRAADDVATADDEPDVDPELMQRLDLVRQAVHHLRRDAEALLARERLAAQLEYDAPVLQVVRRHPRDHSPSW
jgi:histidinol phosphatase-like PHP family hydrolase